MNILGIPYSYRITEKDCNEAWLIYADKEKYIKLSEEHEEQASLEAGLFNNNGPI